MKQKEEKKEIQIQDNKISLEIIKKANKNIYLRFKEDTLVVTVPFFTSRKDIEKVIYKNQEWILKTWNQKKKKEEKEKQFYYLGNPYDLIFYKEANPIFMKENKIYVKDSNTFDKWLLEQTKRLFQERLSFQYQRFEEKIPYPVLKLRKMKTRWGVCNRKNTTVTLNTLLIHYPIEALDYVIIHELSHFVEFNHSKSFWKIVSKYDPEYKTKKKMLKE